MHCWTIMSGFEAPRVVAGIRIDNEAITLGEEGRGRQLTTLPLPPAAVLEQDRITGETRLMTFGDEPGIALVIRNLSGFRGSWALYGNYTSPEWVQILERRLAHRENGNGMIRPGHTGFGHCPACDAFPVPDAPHPVPGGLIRAQGFAAQGDAGRMGGGPEYLLIIRSYVELYAVRQGRTYGTPKQIIITVDPPANRIHVEDVWDSIRPAFRWD